MQRLRLLIQWTFAICGMLLLVGCANISKEDIATGLGATAGAAVGSLTGSPAVVITTTSAGAAVGATVVAPDNSNDVAITEVQNEHQADVAKKQLVLETIADAWHWIVGAVVFLILVFWFVPTPQSIVRRNKQ